MPSMFQLAALLIGGAAVVACSGRSTPNVPPEGQDATPVQSAVVGVTPQNATFSLERGKTFSVGLASAGGGGYEWHLEQGFDQRVVHAKGQRVGELPANAPLGKFADEIFDFETVGSGQTTLVFTLYREWEGPSKAVETRRYVVTVN